MLTIPNYQPIPFPAPLWLLQVLLVLGFFIHALFMNVALAGPLIAGVLLLQARNSPKNYSFRLGHSLALSLPLFVSFAITQGIVPLLFLQLVYGPLYYTSSILMAVPWIGLLLLLMIGYYLIYLYKHKSQQLGAMAPWVLIGVGILFAGVGFIFSNNMTLMLNPAKWPSIMTHYMSGLYLNLDDPQLFPRYLHMLFAAFAVTGLVIGCFGLYCDQSDRNYATWLIKTGSQLFLLVTIIQLPVGAWFSMSLPSTVMKNYMGGDLLGLVSFAGSMVCALLALVSIAVAWKNGSRIMFKIGLCNGLLVVLGMSVMRHLLRVYTTQSFLHPEMVPIKIQWDLLIVFVVLAVLLIAYLTWLARLVLSAFKPGNTVTHTSKEVA